MVNINKFCLWLDLNRGPLVSEATALPTEPQQLPSMVQFYNHSCRHFKFHWFSECRCFELQQRIPDQRQPGRPVTRQELLSGPAPQQPHCCLHAGPDHGATWRANEEEEGAPASDGETLADVGKFQRQVEQLLWIRGRGGGGQVPTERAQLRLLQSEFDYRSVKSILRCN